MLEDDAPGGNWRFWISVGGKRMRRFVPRYKNLIRIHTSLEENTISKTINQDRIEPTI